MTAFRPDIWNMVRDRKCSPSFLAQMVKGKRSVKEKDEILERVVLYIYVLSGKSRFFPRQVAPLRGWLLIFFRVRQKSRRRRCRRWQMSLNYWQQRNFGVYKTYTSSSAKKVSLILITVLYLDSPYHEHSEYDALRRVHQHGQGVVAVLVVGQYGSVVEHRGQEVDRGDGDQQEEGGLHQRAFVDRLAVEDGYAQRHEDGGAGTVHHGLVEKQALTPPVTKEFSALNVDDRTQRDKKVKKKMYTVNKEHRSIFPRPPLIPFSFDDLMNENRCNHSRSDGRENVFPTYSSFLSSFSFLFPCTEA